VTGKTGIEIARASLPDVILLDLNLPDINGYSIIKILQSEPDTQPIPVIAISANAMLHDVEKGMKAGFFRYITKPIRVSELTLAVNMALDFSETMTLKSPDFIQI
jgi:CheY-like chemotaxis protein